MSTFNKFISVFLLNILLFISCQKNPNTNKIEIINDLEKISLIDEKNLNAIHTQALENNIKISNFNLLTLEEMKLDSISVELIYFEYRDYLNCINSMRLLIEKINNLKKDLILNRNQLQNIKEDYLNSSNIRNDLDTHLKHEAHYVNKVSAEIKQVLNLSRNVKEKFDTLNNQIELIIDEK